MIVRALALLTVAAWSLAAAAVAPDYAREARWADEVAPQVVVGDVVWLVLADRPRVLALYTVSAGKAKGAVVVVHGLGVHPDWGLNGVLRSELADRGYATLSVQMPVLAAEAARDDYAGLYADAADRIAAAVAWLRSKGYTHVALVSHSLGAAMADTYFTRRPAAVDAWVPVGMLVEFSTPPHAPVLDVVAAYDIPAAIASAKRRRTALPRDGCSAAVTIGGTDHYFEKATTPLADAAAAFFDRVFAGRCR